MLAIGYRCRFEPHHLECVRIAHDRQFGAVKVIDAHFGFNIDPGVWRLKRALSGGGPLMDVGIYRVLAESGWFGLDPAFNYGGLRGLRSDGQAIDPPSTDQFAVEMDDFAQCIRRKTPTRVPGEEGLTDVRIMTAIYESARAGKPIQLHRA